MLRCIYTSSCFKNIKQAIVKSTILKLEKMQNRFENIVFASIKHVKFQKSNFNIETEI